MSQSYLFKLTSECPIEVVYGVSAGTLEAIKLKGTEVSGYDWLAVLDNSAEQREVFLSGLAKEDAELSVTDPCGDTSIYDFRFQDDVSKEEDQTSIILCDRDLVRDAGEDLCEEIIDYLIVARIDLKYRNWIARYEIEDNFDKNKVVINIKDRDSSIDIAQLIYSSFDSDHEESIDAILYDGQQVFFEEDMTSYPPAFLCLKKVSSEWQRVKELEQFFEGIK